MTPFTTDARARIEAAREAARRQMAAARNAVIRLQLVAMRRTYP